MTERRYGGVYMLSIERNKGSVRSKRGFAKAR